MWLLLQKEPNAENREISTKPLRRHPNVTLVPNRRTLSKKERREGEREIVREMAGGQKLERITAFRKTGEPANRFRLRPTITANAYTLIIIIVSCNRFLK